ncbi:MAG: lamin tail domain-containing protein [Planctomycetota bacterium]
MLRTVRIWLLSSVLTMFWAGWAYAQPYPAGDLNGDRSVNFEDMQILAQRWLDPSCLVPGCEADLNGAGGINMVDFALLAEDWGVEGATLAVSEFMASNSSTLLDENGDSSDWIEIYNPTDRIINLDGWHLTDDAGNLTQWEFPDGVGLDPGQFLVVFASEKNQATAGSELHTNFRLDVEGDYLALVQSDGVSIAHEYRPVYPQQLTDISYGLRQYSKTLVAPSATASYHVPAIGDAGADWAARGFDDSRWQRGPTGLGFGFGGEPRVAYNDCVYEDSQYKAENVTTYGTGSGFSGLTSGPLVDQATGEEMNVTVTFTESGGVNWQPNPGNGGGDAAPGTDAHTTFSGIADMTGVIYYGSAGWWIDLTFTGLDPGTEYTFATSAIRSNYEGRLTVYTLTGADTYANAGTDGVEEPAENKVRFNTGDNYNEGYVARWTGITASDGSFTVRAEADPSSTEGRKAYSFDVFMLRGGFSGSDVQQQMQNINASLWTRVEFDLEDEEADFFDTLTLRMKYEDGFVAYLNGVEVARDNFAGTPAWNSKADSDRQNQLAAGYVNFDISDYIGVLRQGTNVLAIHALNDDPADLNFLILPELAAASSMGVPQYFVTATPGGFNVPGAIDVVADTTFSNDRGFYDVPFEVAVECETPGARIHFTTDGSAPSETHGQEYTSPIPIYTTTCLRALAFKPGWIPTNVDTQTYIFLDHVINQPGNPPGFPTSWGGTTADYEMDPDVVDDPRYRGLMRDSLLSLPTMSVVTDLDNLFGPSGIYNNPGGGGIGWERPASAEWINPDGTTGFQVNAGLRIYGGAFRGMSLTRKKTFRLLFKRKYGPTKLRYPLFGEDAVTNLDTIILRGGANDAWNNWGRENTQYIVDEFMRRTQLALGRPSGHGTFVHLYVNGLYWGLYNPCERPQASFAANYFGGYKEDWDALNSASPVGGSSTATWNAMLGLVRQGVETNQVYQRLQGKDPNGANNPGYDDLLDVPNYIDYMFSNFWGGTGDWPGHNWYGACHRPPNATGFKFFNWDSEGAIVVWSNLNANTTGVNDGAGEPYNALRQNAEFRLLFADHAHRHLFNNGPATSEVSYARYKELADQIELSVISESARWGDQAQSTPYKLTDWQATRDYILGTYMPRRPALVLEQLRGAGLYPDVDAPVFYINGLPQHGGQISRSDSFLMTGTTGKVYYTVDGSDPRLATWMSAPGEAVILVAENAAKRVFVPTEANEGDLLGNTPAEFEVTYYKANVNVGDLDTAEAVISDPSYRSTVATEMSPTVNYVNTGSGGNFGDDKPFPGTSIGSDVEDFVILATATIIIPGPGAWSFGVNSDDGFELRLTNGAQTFTLSYPSPRGPGDTVGVFNVTVPGPYELRLVFYERGGGSELELFAARGDYSSFMPGKFHLVGDLASGIQIGEGNIWFSSYLDDSTWPSGTGGVAYEAGSGYESLIGIEVGSEMYNQNSTCYIRIPFAAGDVEYGDLILKVRYDDGFIAYLNGSEVARRNFTGNPTWESAASAENPDSSAVVFENIDISEHTSALHFGDNVLAIHGLNISASDSDFLIDAGLVGSKITQGDVSPGAAEYLAPIQLTQSAHIKARAFDGRWSALNEAPFSVGPVAENVRITEIMYHPQFMGDANDRNAEFIELKNIGAETLNLNLVRFTDGIDFTFPSLQLAAGEYILAVKDRNVFEAKHGTAIDIAGEYSGSLDNGGERIRLEDAAGRTILDFEYKDGWRPITDGDGFSLTIIDPINPDPNSWARKDSWRASAFVGGSPGQDDTGVTPDPGSLVINEVLAHSHGYGPDWIELYNATGEPIDIGGWFLSDNGSVPMKFQIDDGAVVDAYGYLVFYEDLHFGNTLDPGCIVPFALSENGEEVVLSSSQGGALTGYQEVQDFGASETDVSFGRYINSVGDMDFVAMSQNKPGLPNAYPKVGPIIINEIMYHPEPHRDAEFIELYNITGSTVDLFDVLGNAWKFSDEDYAIDCNLPADANIPGYGYLLLVNDEAVFESTYTSVPANVQIIEWSDGRLDNGGEEVRIGRPGDVDAFGTRYYICVDMVDYDDEDSWPTEPDGGGASLSRMFAERYGNDPNNWSASSPSPGKPNL